MGIMISYHGYNDGYNNPTYKAHKNVGVHYTQQITGNSCFLFHVLHNEVLLLA